MSYSAAVRKEIYLSWKPVFSNPRYSQLRKLGKIKEVIDLYAPASHKFWHPNLAKILKELLEQNVFYLDIYAKDHLPEIFSSAQAKESPEMPSSSGKSISTAQSPLDGNTCNDAYQELAESLKRLYTSGAYSDLEITCQGKSYPVHKAIVCPRSAFLAAACSGQFKEALDGKIDLPDDDPGAVGAMISYLYCPDYQNGIDSSTVGEDPADFIQAPETCPELVAHARVYILAEKYLIGGLKTLALRKFTTSVHDHFNVDSFLQAMEEVYSTTLESDKGLRDIIIRTLYQQRHLLDRKEIQVILKDLGEATFDLAMYMKGM